MGQFIYTARTKSGEKVEGSVEANDRLSALQQIESQGYTPVSVKEGSSVTTKPGKRRFQFKVNRGADRMGTRELLTFTTELSDLLASGMTLGNALNCLARRRTGKSGDTVVADLRDEIIRGTSLSTALEKHSKTFSNLYVSMIRAGEVSGAIDEVLRRLVDHYERVESTKGKIVGALVYPVIVMIAGVGIMIFSMIWVVPKFEMVFRQMGQELPLPTKMLIGMSGFIVKYGWLVAILMTVATVMLVRVIHTERGRIWWDGMKLKAPLIKGIVASGIYANFAHTLGTLLQNGVPVLQSLGIVERTVGNVVIGTEIRNARARVTDGTTISGPLSAGGVFPEMMTDMLSIGEQTGDMPGALKHISRRYENELDRNLKIMTTALEPILIVFVALMVGFIAISILMAVFNITNGLDL